MASSLPVTFNPDSYSVGHDGTTTPEHVDQASILYCRNCHQGVVVIKERRIGDRRSVERGVNHIRQQQRGPERDFGPSR